MGRVVSIDYGLARIGLALSDERKIIASPFKVLAAKKTTLATIESLLEALQGYEIDLIVIGLPLKFNGKNSFMTDEVEHFFALLQTKAPCPVICLDERLTSIAAEKALREANMSRKKRSKVIDGVAAAILLQNYLDSIFIKETSLI